MWLLILNTVMQDCGNKTNRKKNSGKSLVVFFFPPRFVIGKLDGGTTNSVTELSRTKFARFVDFASQRAARLHHHRGTFQGFRRGRAVFEGTRSSLKWHVVVLLSARAQKIPSQQSRVWTRCFSTGLSPADWMAYFLPVYAVFWIIAGSWPLRWCCR